MSRGLDRLARDYARIEEAIRFLEANFRRQPSLEEVAAHVGLSPFHFQRCFRRWAGVTPKQFLQYLTAGYAKELLRQSHSVLDTSLDCGLSGPGRLHDLFVTLEALTPGEYKALGAGLAIRCGFHPTPFGICLVAVTDRGICALRFVSDDGRKAALAELQREWPRSEFREDRRETGEIVRRLFGAEPPLRDLPLAVLVKGTNFQIKVWEALLRIPAGVAASYGEIARLAGAPRASRAVGSAIGANPVAFLIPCHRVLRESGAIGGYRWGTARKRAILAWETARLREAE
ncbi:methylated-DNA--[protein]-cysteine S-methyltransferase [Geobacter sp.]|uniref:methylated-DNA--[protein]-cysteine S-methyltransferase n=1 Tax=Geobacter sp. TaxID=46610 RepID=UPI00261184BC|nr:methylated-DNA--[protein]-cysteine S-methyltransferase [Geobacter sp.]